MKQLSRTTMALVLTIVYLAIIMSPLAPLPMRSPVIVHAMTGECVGDCDICGCSPEQRAARTCCCQQKKALADRQVADHADHDEQTPDCCRKDKAPKKIVLTCSCPCGKGKPLALWSGEKSELLPYRFVGGGEFPSCTTNPADLSQRLASRHGDPPDPPPKLTRLS